MIAKKDRYRMKEQNHFHQVVLSEDFHDLQDLPQKVMVMVMPMVTATKGQYMMKAQLLFLFEESLEQKDRCFLHY